MNDHPSIPLASEPMLPRADEKIVRHIITGVFVAGGLLGGVYEDSFYSGPGGFICLLCFIPDHLIGAIFGGIMSLFLGIPTGLIVGNRWAKGGQSGDRRREVVSLSGLGAIICGGGTLILAGIVLSGSRISPLAPLYAAALAAASGALVTLVALAWDRWSL